MGLRQKPRERPLVNRVDQWPPRPEVDGTPQDLEAYMQIELYPISKDKLKSELLVLTSTAMLGNKVSQPC